MWKALVRKELREIAGIAALAAVAYALLVGWLIGATPLSGFAAQAYGSYTLWTGPSAVPFLNAAFGTVFAEISLVFAIALGFRQSAWEWGRHTYLFLLHRPLPRSQILSVKLLSGLGVLLALSAVAIVALAIWAATPGTHPAPFQLSMTADAWCRWLTISPVYLSSFLSGFRSARWFGTRLFPLLVGLSLFVLLAVADASLSTALVAVIVLNAMLAAAIVHVASTQDYS
jgi:ABC-type transport system involved in multi-copper enzyme maturation permease subunit